MIPCRAHATTPPHAVSRKERHIIAHDKRFTVSCGVAGFSGRESGCIKTGQLHNIQERACTVLGTRLLWIGIETVTLRASVGMVS